jgi:heme-degrading monooxygenase HmoA
MIERHWKGIAKKERAGEYIAHLQNDTFKEIKKIKGFISASILKRDLSDGVEFLIVTKWDTLDVIMQFAGEKIDRAVVPKLVQDIMIKYDENVRHYEVNFTTDED